MQPKENVRGSCMGGARATTLLLSLAELLGRQTMFHPSGRATVPWLASRHRAWAWRTGPARFRQHVVQPLGDPRPHQFTRAWVHADEAMNAFGPHLECGRVTCG